MEVPNDKLTKCRTCKVLFESPYGKTFKNCEGCREQLREGRKNRQLYNPHTHKLCRQCKTAKPIQTDFMVQQEKKMNKCRICRAVPVEKKEKEEEVDVDKVLRTVYKNLAKIMDSNDAKQSMKKIEEYIMPPLIPDSLIQEFPREVLRMANDSESEYSGSE